VTQRRRANSVVSVLRQAAQGAIKWLGDMTQLAIELARVVALLAIALTRLPIRKLRKLPRPSAIQWVRGLLVAVTIAAWASWHWASSLPESTFLHEWMPNLGTSSAVIALTLFLIDPLARRHEQGRKRRQIVPILQEIQMNLQDFAEAAAFDYDQTHTQSRLPLEIRNIHWLLAQWERGLVTQDSPRDHPPTEPPVIISAAVSLGDQLKKLDQQHGHELDDAGLSDLKVELRTFVGVSEEAAAYATQVLTAQELYGANPEEFIASDLVGVWESEKYLLPRLAGAALAVEDVYDRKARRSVGSSEQLPQESWKRRRALRRRRLALEPRRERSAASLSTKTEEDYRSASIILARARRNLAAAEKDLKVWSRGFPAEEQRAAAEVAEAKESLENLKSALGDFIETQKVYLATIDAEHRRLDEARKKYAKATSRYEREDAKKEIAFLERSVADLEASAKRSSFGADDRVGSK
jgi:hypothetical protein